MCNRSAFNFLYATQLRLIFFRLLQRQPARPVLGLLNYCLSGGGLDFLQRPFESWMRGSNGAFGEESPLFLMASSQATTDSLVGGLWGAFFATLKKCSDEDASVSIGELFQRTRALYYFKNSYELSNETKNVVYVPRIWTLDFEYGP